LQAECLDDLQGFQSKQSRSDNFEATDASAIVQRNLRAKAAISKDKLSFFSLIFKESMLSLAYIFTLTGFFVK